MGTLSPCSLIAHFPPLESLRKGSANQALPAHFDYKQIILISLFESSLGNGWGKGRVDQISEFYQSSLPTWHLIVTIQRPTIQTEQQRSCRHLHFHPNLYSGVHTKLKAWMTSTSFPLYLCSPVKCFRRHFFIAAFRSPWRDLTSLEKNLWI